MFDKFLKAALYPAMVVSAAAFLFAGCASAPTGGDKPYIISKGVEAVTLGTEAYARGEYERAVEKFKEALRIHRSIDDRTEEVKDLINIGRVYIVMNDTGSAITFLNDAVRLAYDTGHDNLRSEAFATLAKAEHISGRTASALDHLEESLQLDEKTGNRNIGAKLNLKAAIYMAGERGGEAAEILKRALEVNKRHNEDVELANTYRGLAAASAAGGDSASALKYLSSAYELDRKSADTRKIAADLQSMAELHRASGSLAQAAFLMERSYIVYMNGGLKAHAIATLDRLIELTTEMNDPEKSRMYKRMREGIIKPDVKQ